MPYSIASAWRLIGYAVATVLVLIWLEHRVHRHLRTVRGCVVVGLLLAAASAGIELVPYYMLGHLLPSGLRLAKNIVVGIGFAGVFVVYVRFWIVEAKRSRMPRLPED